MSINENWKCVKEFHIKFGHPTSEEPIMISEDRVHKRNLWMKEELVEFVEASDIVEQADALIDLIYFALGTLVEMGIKPQKLFDIVHAANMSKLWSDGKPHYNCDGKTIKPSNWEDPHDKLKDAIEENV